MTAARDELPDFNLLAAFGLKESRNEKDAMRRRLVVEKRDGKARPRRCPHKFAG